MCSAEEIVAEIWQMVANKAGLDLHCSATELTRILDECGHEEEISSQKDLQPWMAILEHEILWLACLHTSLGTALAEYSRHDLRVPWALTGAATAQAMAVRKLCLSGLDVPAKTVLRTLIEILNICVVTLFDPKLRQAYSEAQDFEQAYKLWRSSFSGKKLRRNLSEALKATGFDKEAREVLLQWQMEESTVASQAVHTSYLAAVLSSVPRPSDSRLLIRSGVLGASTTFSIRTLAQACKAIWFFKRLSIDLLIRPAKGNSGALHTLNKESDIDKIVIVGYLALNRTIERFWDEDEIEKAFHIWLQEPGAP
jgi:hypothetical protein